MASTTDPIEQFSQWFKEEQRISTAKIPTACCLSTIGLDGYANARTVSLKEVIDDRFIITCPLNSRKALEIDRNNHVALTFWWPHTERQVRMQGIASRLSDPDADRYFAEREEHIQILTWASEQGAPLESMKGLRDRYERVGSTFVPPVPRPEKWGGYGIDPVRIEFMQFRHDRFHERWSHERVNGKWKCSLLQP